MVLFSFTHADAGFALLCFASAALMALWVLTATVWAVVIRRRGIALERRVYALLILTTAAIAVLFVPYSWLGGY
jgi:ABC-type thiamin/hydroxymethylpyrimidine transport system permease subunit